MLVPGGADLGREVDGFGLVEQGEDDSAAAGELVQCFIVGLLNALCEVSDDPCWTVSVSAMKGRAC